jgi:hypothetical protein
MPEVEQAPEQTTELARQMKVQTDKALNLSSGDDRGKRLDDEFARLGYKGAGELPSHTPSLSPAAPPAKTAEEITAEQKSAVTEKAGEKAKSKIPAKLFEKPGSEAAKGAAPAAAAATTAEDDKPPEGLTEKASARFQELANRAKASEAWRKEHEVKLKTYEEELTKLKSAKPADTEEVAKLRQERDELDAALKQTAIERHPKFKAAYDDRINDYVTSAKKIVGEKHTAAITAILSDPDAEGASEAYEKLAEEVGPFKANQLAMIATNLRQTKSERERELANWKSNSEAMAQSEKATAMQAEKARLSEIEHHVNKAMTEVTREDSDLYVFRKIDGENEWNAGVEQRISEFKNFATKSLTPADQVELSKRAAAAAGAFEMLAEIVPQFRALQSEMEAIRASTPGFGGGSGSGGVAHDPNKSYADQVVEAAAAAGAFPGYGR